MLYNECVHITSPLNLHPFKPCAQSLSYIWLFAAPWSVAHQVLLSTEFSWQEYWNGLPFPSPGDLPNPGIKSMSVASLALAGGFFTTSTTWEGLSNQKLLRNQTCIFMHCPKSPSKLLAQASPRVSSKFAELTAVRTTREACRTPVLIAHLMHKSPPLALFPIWSFVLNSSIFLGGASAQVQWALHWRSPWV